MPRSQGRGISIPYRTEYTARSGSDGCHIPPRLVLAYSGRIMSTLKYVIGVDPGQTGAISVLDRDGILESVVDMPGYGPEPMAMDVAALLEAVGTRDEIIVALEEPFAVQQNSSQASMTQGIGYGILLGVVGTMGLRHERIKPADWKRELGLPMGKKFTSAQKKTNSRVHAARLWPDMASHWEKASHDGRAESALIGECLRRRILGTL